MVVIAYAIPARIPKSKRRRVDQAGSWGSGGTHSRLNGWLVSRIDFNRAIVLGDERVRLEEFR